MPEIVFKQRYKSRNLKSTPILNQKHLIYIATRPGAIHNRDCGFSLFGRLNNSAVGVQDICDFEKTKEDIFETSKKHTIYRAVLSLPHDTAKEKGFYKKENWETLIAQKYNSIAKNMDIETKNFRFVAAFHYSKGHPHIHLMYWDCSNRVRQEFVNHDKFEIIAEKIRADFSREIFGEEIKQEQSSQKKINDMIKTELLSLFKELNAEEPLVTGRVSSSSYSDVASSINKLLKTLPASTSFRYKYLDKSSKLCIDQAIDTIFKIPQFAVQFNKYIKATAEVSKLYGNGKEQIEYQLGKSKQTLYTSLGNTILKYLKENDIRYCPQADDVECSLVVLQTRLRQAVQCDAKAIHSYNQALSRFPPLKTPLSVFANSSFRHEISDTVKQLLKSEETKTAIKPYLTDSVKYAIYSPEFEACAEKAMEDEDINLKEYSKKLEKEDYSKIFKATYRLVLAEMYKDAGYEKQYLFDYTQTLLISLFGSFSQYVGQAKASATLEKTRKGKDERTKDEKKDKNATEVQSGDCEQNF